MPQWNAVLEATSGDLEWALRKRCRESTGQADAIIHSLSWISRSTGFGINGQIGIWQRNGKVAERSKAHGSGLLESRRTSSRSLRVSKGAWVRIPPLSKYVQIFFLFFFFFFFFFFAFLSSSGAINSGFVLLKQSFWSLEVIVKSDMLYRESVRETEWCRSKGYYRMDALVYRPGQWEPLGWAG